MIRNASSTGYSTNVQIRLIVGDRIFDVGQVCDQTCNVRNPVDVEPGPAQLSISVDGNEKVKTVMLPNGIAANSREVRFG